MVDLFARFHFEIVYRKGSFLHQVIWIFLVVNVMRVTRHDSWLYVNQKGNAEVQQMLSDLENGKLDANRHMKKGGLLCYQVLSNDSSACSFCFVCVSKYKS